MAAISTTSSPTFAQDPTSSSTDETVTIPRADWKLCRDYKATLVTRNGELKACAEQGREVRKKKEQCVGELSGKKDEATECHERSRQQSREDASTIALLRADAEKRKSPWFWIGTGGVVASVIWLAIEVAGGGAPELPKVIAGGAVAAGSTGLVIFTW